MATGKKNLEQSHDAELSRIALETGCPGRATVEDIIAAIRNLHANRAADREELQRNIAARGSAEVSLTALARDRSLTVWLQVVAIAFIVIGVALLRTAQTTGAGIHNEIARVRDEVVRLDGWHVFSGGNPWMCSNATGAQWPARGDGACYAEDAPYIAASATTAVHTLETTVTEPCWVRTTELAPLSKVLGEGTFKHDTPLLTFMTTPVKVEIRSGCPGAVRYRVNGKDVTPPNLSKTPDKSEVVEIDL